MPAGKETCGPWRRTSRNLHNLNLHAAELCISRFSVAPSACDERLAKLADEFDSRQPMVVHRDMPMSFARRSLASLPDMMR